MRRIPTTSAWYRMVVPRARAKARAIASIPPTGCIIVACQFAQTYSMWAELAGQLGLELEAYADAAAANLIALAAQIALGKDAPELNELAFHAGIAQAIAGLLAAFAIHSRRGQLYVPLELLQRHGSGREDVSNNRATPALRAGLAELCSIARRHLRQARELAARAPADAMPAFLPVALAGPMLARMERDDYDPFVPVVIAPWRRQWRMWRAAREPARIFR